MNLLSKLKRRITGTSEASSTETDEGLIEAERDTRAAEKILEKEGIPSVNRGTSNRLITIVGFIAILCVAVMLIISANSGKAPIKTRKSESEPQIASTLPPLVVPPVPPPLRNTGNSATEPQSFLGGGSKPTVDVNGKPILHWSERKLQGGVLVNTQTGDMMQGNSASAHQVAAVESEKDTAFGESLEPTVTKSAVASILGDRNYLITKGSELDCVMQNALDSSLPGIATCVLSEDAYSDNGKVLLLDRGSELFGESQGGIKQGQVRVGVLWTRASTPHGVVIALDSPGTDALGRTGLEGWVDNHFLERFGAAILMTFVRDAATALVNRSTNTSAPFFGSTPTAGSQVVDRILQSTVNIPPTIVKNQGDHIKVIVARDLDFSKVYTLRVDE
jgi:type IV secretion system protein VirB10